MNKPIKEPSDLQKLLYIQKQLEDLKVSLLLVKDLIKPHLKPRTVLLEGKERDEYIAKRFKKAQSLKQRRNT